VSSAAPWQELFDRGRRGERGALARLLSVAEAGGAQAAQLDALCAAAAAPRARSIGITGAPGAGKSTLTAALLGVARNADQRAAVLAIDPSSPLTGGAILGDRVRMHQAAVDEGVFIRSMASRGQQGGLAQAASLGVRVLEACGWPWILLETVGIGQVEVEISGRADLVVVVLNPGWGDEIQANKAGLMEVADIFVINKADREGVAQTRRDIEGAIAARPGGQQIPVIETIATRGEGVPELWQAIVERHAALDASGELAVRRRARIAAELESAALSALRGRLAAAMAAEEGVRLRERIASGDCGIHEGVATLLGNIVRD
jgi:LAO/AO transport system kinase